MKSTIVYIIYLGPNSISWSCKKQQKVAKSFTEAKYCRIASATTELLWLQELFKELCLPLIGKPLIYLYNIGATYLCANPAYHSWMKHFSIYYYFVHELVSKKELVSDVPSNHYLADLLIKYLSLSKHQWLMSKIGVASSTTILRGRVDVINSNP